MTGKRLLALLLALMLTITFAGCGEETSGDTATDPTDTATTTTAAPMLQLTKQQLVDALEKACASLTSYAVTEQITVTFEMSGNVAAQSELEAQLTVTPDAMTAVCKQELEEGAKLISLYSVGDRLYVQDDDYRYTLELSFGEALKNYGVVTLDGMPGFDNATLIDALELTETENGYALSCSLSGDAVKGEMAELANSLLGEMSGTLENPDVTALSVTVELLADGTPTRIAYSMTENALNDGNFFTVSAEVDATFTAVGDAVTLTPPEDLTAYEGAEAAYRAILDAVLEEDGSLIADVSKVYDALTAQYDKALVDSVLYMLGAVV